ncbi:hypothetical protein, partial [Nocardia acidivorans]|uniref:hypothetical protein n=1 Tax=Nocardia acidivorans TaxID=404580 RepID=UPI001C3F7E66
MRFEVDQFLPAVCAEHGRPALGIRAATVKLPRRHRDSLPDGARSANLRGDWPICRTCDRA